MGDLQLYGMNQSGLGGIPYFQATQFKLAIKLGIEMSPELVAGAYAEADMTVRDSDVRFRRLSGHRWGGHPE